MKLVLNKKYYTWPGKCQDDYQGTYYLIFMTKPFSLKWFTDCGEWFVYIHIGKRWWRFSSAGYMKGIGNNVI
jgi:hypothetical protein